MLKKICGLFLGLVVCAGSACVTPTHASSAVPTVFMTRVQAAGEYGAKDETIAIYNSTDVEADITNWCVQNKFAVSFACFTPQTGSNDHFFIPAHSSVVLASAHHLAMNEIEADGYAYAYTVSHGTWGSMVGSSDTISLHNDKGEVVDSVSWENAAGTNKLLERFLVASLPLTYAVTGLPSDWLVNTYTPPPYHGLEIREGDDTDTPETPLDDSPVPSLSEILANVKGSDKNNEFIELYNSHPTSSIDLSGFSFVVGQASPKTYAFPIGATIPAMSYYVVTNAEVAFSLVNTSGAVRIIQAGVVVASVDYADPKDDMAWALVDGIWGYSSTATPGGKNILTTGVGEGSVIGKSTTKAKASRKPCDSHQFRNPATGRCKLLAVAAVPKPCAPGQVRNPETKRCRKVVAATQPTPCKEGQARHPETNRCRKIVAMTKATHGVKGAQETADAQLQWYYWVAIAGVVGSILAYGVWEWRDELRSVWARLRERFAKNKL